MTTAIFNSLRDNRYRLTKIRKSIIEALFDAAYPFTVQEVIEALNARKTPADKTTVYRELSFLTNVKVLAEIELLDGKKRYEILNQNGHHHHLVCTDCSKIVCIDPIDNLNPIKRKLERKHGFQVKSHVLEFFGVCSSCR